MTDEFMERPDVFSREIEEAFQAGYLPGHPAAEVNAYRYNPASVRVRVIDPDFDDKPGYHDRERMIKPVLRSLRPEVMDDISMILLLTLHELDDVMNRVFEHPSRTRIS